MKACETSMGKRTTEVAGLEDFNEWAKSINATIKAHRKWRKKLWAGTVRRAVENMVEKKYPGLRVRVSSSPVKTLSFYVVDSGTKIIKISDHFTNMQRIEYPECRYVNVDVHTSTIEVKREVRKLLKEMGYTCQSSRHGR